MRSSDQNICSNLKIEKIPVKVQIYCGATVRIMHHRLTGVKLIRLDQKMEDHFSWKFVY